MRIAAFNVENLFERAKALNENDWVNSAGSNGSRWSAGRKVLDAYSKLNALFTERIYSASDKAEMVRLLVELGLTERDESKLVILRKNRGSLLKRTDGDITITADGRDDWIGWLDLKKEPVDERATQNTARVLRDVDADVVVVVEAENRTSLARFNEVVLGQAIKGLAYDHIMLVDGNDERGIDVGLMTRKAAPIAWLRSHVDDRDGDGRIFSRDCPEFHLKLASGERLVILANHFKSKGFGVASRSNARREAQARRVREIYEELKAEGINYIAIAGDFNDTPDSEPLRPLLGDNSDLKDISQHEEFDDGGRPGTYANGTKGNKIDYMLLSPALFEKAKGGGIFRKGVWGGTKGKLWDIYPEMERAEHAASDHAAIYADMEI